MFHPDTQFLIDRWIELARARETRSGIPLRAQLRPEILGIRLPRAFLLEGLGSDAVFRVAGSWIEALQDRPLTGRRFFDLWCPASPVLVAPALAQASRQARPVVIVAQVEPGSAPAEVVVAPLRSGASRPDLFIGLVGSAATPARAAGDRARLSARVSIAAGDPGRPDLRLIPSESRFTAASGR